VSASSFGPITRHPHQRTDDRAARPYQRLGRIEQSEVRYRRTLALDPVAVSAWVNLGNLLGDGGRFGEACDCHRNALRIEPNGAEHHLRMGRSLRLLGDITGALAHAGVATALDPANDKAHSALLFTSQYEEGLSREELARRHFAWGALKSRVEPLPAAVHPQEEARAKGPITVGFLSADLGNHPVGIFIAPLLERLAKQAGIRTVCYSDAEKTDEFLTRNRSAAHEWRDVAGLTDDTLASLIREDGVDVLFELAGHTEQNRLPLLARRPAPVQVSWAGYVGTTGLAAIDFVLTDSFHSPDGLEEDYAETLLRFPCGYISYEPPPYAPDPGPLPMAETGSPTFGCLNNPAKLGPATVRLWSRILREIPGSRLVLKYKGMDDIAVRHRLLGLFSANGVEPGRVEMLGQTPHADHLATFQRIDIALDPSPYSGGLSTCEALWMGVPVVTLPGRAFAGRHSLSHLSNAGITDTIARDEDDFVRIALGLAARPDALAAIRHTQRERVRQSALCDLDGYANDFISALRAITADDRAGRPYQIASALVIPW
jgi:protein O-GlcNAc transferase